MGDDRGKKILLAHGSGGSLTRRLIEDVFAGAFNNELLAPLNDQAVFTSPGQRLAFTTDSYVIDPIFFPGGDIGKLSVCGTINDLAVGGARPLYLSASFIIEEGLAIDELKRVVESMAREAAASGISIITGDTKVVERGKGDKLFINTAGIGVVADGITLSPEHIRPGDGVIVSGTIGDHGIAIMTKRAGIEMDAPTESDCASLWGLVECMLGAGGKIKAMRDATRGGVATVLNEFALSSNTTIVIEEDRLPIKSAVSGACELLGFDPLSLANEGKLVAVVSGDTAEQVLTAMKGHPLGAEAALIGRVEAADATHKGRLIMETSIGNRRIIDMPSGEQLPRIC